MSLDLARVSLAVSGGLSVVCAMCVKYWRGVDAKLPRCTATDGCGSPLAGDDFHEYEGPLTSFVERCFVCGESSAVAVVQGPAKRPVGVCKEHLPKFDELRAVGAGDQPAVLFRSPQGFVPLDKLLPRKPKSIMAEIAKTEAYFAEKEGREVS